MIRNLLMLQQGQDVALIDGDHNVTYDWLRRRAGGLQQHLPVRQQGCVALLLPNGGDFVAAFWGVVMAGHTVLPLGVQLTPREIATLLNRAAVSTVVTVAAFGDLFCGSAELASLPLKVIYIDQMETAQRTPTLVDSHPDEVMLLLNTSGTTCHAKLVMLSEINLRTAVLGYLGKLRQGDMREARFVLAAPFASVYGIMILCACLYCGFPVVVTDDIFTLDALYRTVERHRVTNYEGSATAIHLMARMAGRHIPYDISTLSALGFGGSKVSGEVIAALQSAHPGIGVYQGYGMTEAAPLIAKHPHGILRKTGSVGNAIVGVTIGIEVDGIIVTTPHTQGEIVVRGANVMLGYLGDAEQTADALRGGYLHTGDIGYLDEEGYLYICGRMKSMVVVRGFKVYAEEVEDCLLDSGLVVDAFAYGVDDGSGNETLCADIVPVTPTVDEAEIRSYCAVHLAEYKRPTVIRLRDGLVKTPTGKTVRREDE